jgi:hypothetical protein
MIAETETIEWFDAGLEGLLKSTEWKLIAEMPEVTNRFNLFDLLEDAVCENAWSRIIHFLFDSSRDHNLGLIPVTKWITDALDAPFPELIKSAKKITSETEWSTLEGRRLDILLKLLDADGRLLGVVGIENKVWSGEQIRQLSDYQEALANEFRGIPKILVFLTPDRREPLTASESSECRVQRVSYDSVVKTCDVLIPRTTGDLRLLISSLRAYINRNILRKYTMEKQIKESVAKLYQDVEKRRVIELIVEHRPTVRAVMEGVATSVESGLRTGTFGAKIGCSHDFWPANDDFAPEFRLWPEGLNARKGFGICYMLRSETRKPFIGDKFTLLLNAWCDDEAVRTRMEELRSRLPARHSHKYRHWSNWTVLWEGGTYQLQDMGTTDMQQLSFLLADAVRQTLEPLRAALGKC